MTVVRFDSFALNTMTRTDEGFLVGKPVVTRTGIFKYADPSKPDGWRRELRRPEEVFSDKHLASMRGKPITFGHVSGLEEGNLESVRGVDGKEWRSVGAMVSAGEKGEDPTTVVTELAVHHTDAVDKHGYKELSLGYTLDYDPTPGMWEGQRYDGEQKNLNVTHVAFVRKGRAGVAKVNLDSVDDVPFAEKPEENRMPQVRLDSGLSYEAAPEVIHELTQYRAAVETQTARADSVTAERDALQARYDAAVANHRTEMTTQQETLRAQIRQRMDMEDVASGLGLKATDGTSDKDLRVAIITKVNGDSIDLSAKSEAYIEAAYDLALANVDKTKRNDNAATQLSGGVGSPLHQAAMPDGEKVRSDAMDARNARLTSAWQTKAGEA